MLLTTATAWADDEGYDYYEADGTLKNTATDDNPDNDIVTEIGQEEHSLEDGWYAVEGNGRTPGKFNVNGDVHLILCGATEIYIVSIDIKPDSRLTIYCDGGGSTFVNPGDGDTGIIVGDGASLTVNSGRVTVNATGSNSGISVGSDASFTVNGRTYNGSSSTTIITANSTSGRGIDVSGGSFAVNGGLVTASSISGGFTIAGGTVKATGKIYGGFTIAGGTVVAGDISGDDDVTLNGGTVRASSISADLTLKGGTVTAEYYWGDLTIGDDWTYTDGTTAIASGTTITIIDEPVESTTYQPEWTGNGTADGPYLMKTHNDLDLLAKRVNGGTTYGGTYFQMDNDIEYDPNVLTLDYNLITINQHGTPTEIQTYESNYIAIGGLGKPFCGIFNGDNHTISGIRVRKTGTDDADGYQGIFGLISNDGDNKAVVRNIVLDETQITGFENVGGIVGKIAGGTVENCHVTSHVAIHGIKANANAHGCIAGFNGGKVTSCTSDASLFENSAFCESYGGIVGSNVGIVSECLYVYNNKIDGSKKVGFIAGYNTGTVSYCYYTNNHSQGKDGDGNDLDNAASAVGVNSGTVTNSGLGYYIVLGENITCDALTVGRYTVAPNGQEVNYTNHTAGAPLGYQYGFTVAYGTDPDDPGNEWCTSKIVTSNTDVLLSTHEAVSVGYVLANGTEQEAQAVALDGTETTLGAGWYFVGLPEVNYGQTLDLDDGDDNNVGEFNLILCDGCTMNVGTSEARIDDYGIAAEALTIYGQTKGTGALNVYTTGGTNDAIIANALTINGGNITANTDGDEAYALNADTDITINGGNITAHTTGFDGIAITSGNGDVTINGGNVCANATGSSANAIAANGDFHYNGGKVTATSSGSAILASGLHYNFSWRTPADCITIGTTGLYAPDGATATFSKAFTDGNTIYSTTLTGSELSVLAGKNLYPYVPNLDLAANAHDGNCWTTFYCGHTGYKIDDEENACAYTAEYDGAHSQLTLHRLGKVIPKDKAVIIVGEDNSISMTASDETAAVPANNLHGSDVRTLKSTLGTGTFYVMGKVDGDFGFFEYTADYMPARKAYLLVNGGAAQVKGLTMVFDGSEDATSIQNSKLKIQNEEAGWYSLDGRKLDGKPTAKGIVIHNGKKVVVK